MFFGQMHFEETVLVFDLIIQDASKNIMVEVKKYHSGNVKTIEVNKFKNWKFDNIPEESHFFWGGNPMPYLNFLSILSFRKLNPDWKINLYTSPNRDSTRPSWQTGEQSIEYTGRDYFSDAAEIADQVHKIDFPRELNHDVHKADFMRIYLMAMKGGVWSDFDILYLESMNSLSSFIDDRLASIIMPFTGTADDHFQQENVWPTGVHHLSLGIILAKPNTAFFSQANQIIPHAFNKNSYQCLGIWLLHKVLPLLNSSGWRNMPMKCFYPFYYIELEKLFAENHPLPENTLGIHWYGGAEISMRHKNIIDENYAKQSPSTMSAAINKVLEL